MTLWIVIVAVLFLLYRQLQRALLLSGFTMMSANKEPEEQGDFVSQFLVEFRDGVFPMKRRRYVGTLHTMQAIGENEILEMLNTTTRIQWNEAFRNRRSQARELSRVGLSARSAMQRLEFVYKTNSRNHSPDHPIGEFEVVFDTQSGEAVYNLYGTLDRIVSRS